VVRNHLPLVATEAICSVLFLQATCETGRQMWKLGSSFHSSLPVKHTTIQ